MDQSRSGRPATARWPAQWFEELGVAEVAGGVLDLGEGVGVCHVAAR